jgi:LAS superfamily LD-carboxypeptidase LdcB
VKIKTHDDKHSLTGQTQAHLVTLAGSTMQVHHEVAAPFGRLCAKAFRAGFELQAVSTFRSFEAQLRIWNQKATGQRPLLGAQGEVLDVASLTPKQIVYAILNWSALPGASRHHWGTDLDVIDRLSVPPRYQVQLIPEEVNKGGMFANLHEWLDRHMFEEGFYRPYQQDLGGVKPERWHLSYAPTSERLFAQHSEELLRATLQASALELKEVVLAELPEIFDRFFRRISDAPGTRKS